MVFWRLGWFDSARYWTTYVPASIEYIETCRVRVGRIRVEAEVVGRLVVLLSIKIRYIQNEKDGY